MFTGYGICYRLDAPELATALADDPTHWTCNAVEHCRRTVLDPEFPCLFGRKAMAARTCHVLFARARTAAADIARGAAQYIDLVRTAPAKARIGSPLLAFIQTDEHSTLAAQQTWAWSILQGMHALDPRPWPASLTQDPHDPQWAFCFNGMPLFVNMSFPGHRLMKSRHLGPHIVFVINPRENFDEVASANTSSGQGIRAKIRQRVAHYNDGVMPQTLGFFGQPDNFEWQQYQLHETGALEPQRCPFRADPAPHSNAENES
ncbi:YqcI/YcgG family protein [Pseudomonas phoenicis]|uniref:YqcI/YcgG family protein n=1 Tax=unclassified Pseudomonas TaxID=196821 RepID=UPI0039A1C99E